MVRHIRSLFLVLLAGVLTSCGESLGPIDELPRELTLAESKLIDADNRFAFKLFREVSTQEDDGANVFVSPLSVGMALGMTYNGAAGDTRDAMQQTLELDGMTVQEVNEAYRSLIDLLRTLDQRVEFTLANSIWYRQGIPIVPEFLQVNQQYFDAEVSSLNFSDPGAVDVINDWVNDQTRGKIEEIVEPPINPLTIMFLINAIYFKGDWTHQFDKSRTKNEPFELPDGSHISVPMMSREERTPVRLFQGLDHTVVDLFYGGKAYSMTIVVPDDPSDIDALARGLTASQWDSWVLSLDSVNRYVSIPKFTLEYEITLNDVLSALGMDIAFDPGLADLTNLFAGGGAYIEKVKHKTFVDVNEEGTEAAAVTSVEVTLTSAPMPVIVNRPFIFAIRENYSGTILFMGKIVRPNN